MRKYVIPLGLLGLAAFPVFAEGASVHIAEVMFNPVGTDTAAEYISIRNNGTSSESLSGWELYPDGIGYYMFSDFSLAPGASITIHLRASGSDSDSDRFHTAATENMGNTSGSVALFSSSDRNSTSLRDFVEWGRSGETWESAADTAGIWTKGEFIDVASMDEGKSILRSGTGSGVSAWSIGSASITPPPPAPSASPPPSTDNPPPSASPPPASTSGSGLSVKPQITAAAGKDQIGVVGGSFIFLGGAYNAEGNEMKSDLIRYAWNFGDGEVGNGKRVSHTYRFPGNYTVALTVVSGELSATDRLSVKVKENPIYISEIFPGRGGWIEIVNPSTDELLLSGWHLHTNAKNFTFPEATVIAPKSFLVISESTSGINLPNINPDIKLLYPNGHAAAAFVLTGTIPSGESAALVDELIRIGVPSPGAESAKIGNNASISKSPTTLAKLSSNSESKTAQNNNADAKIGKKAEGEKGSETKDLKDANEDAPIKNDTALAAVTKSSMWNEEYLWLVVSVIAGLILGGAVYVLRKKMLR